MRIAFRLALPFALLAGSAIAQAQGAGTTAGPVTAPVSIVVYADLECPFSAATLPEVEKVLAAHKGEVRLDVRQFPLTQHEHAPLAHEAALAAAAQGRFLPMVDLIQANQKLMDREQYLHYAALLRLNLVQFKRDLDSHRFAATVQQDLAEGRALGIDTTPTLFVNGTKLAGAQDAPSLEALITRSLAASNPSVNPGDAGNPLPAEDIAALAVKPEATLGVTDAPVTIVEFTDFQCPFCRRAEEPVHQLLAASGKNIHLVYRSFPLDFHAHAELAAEAALAAGAQGKFWPMHDLLFANQTSLDRAHLDDFARQLNLDVARFDDDLSTGKFRAAVASDRALGQRYGVDGTPFFFINGRALVGARSLPELQQAVQLALGNTAKPAAELAAAGEAPRNFLPTPGSASGSASPGTMVDWFLDVEASASPAIAQIVRTLQVEPGVRIAVHHFALPSHPNAALAFRALMAARQEGRFWELYDRLAAHTLPEDPKDARAAIVSAATAASVSSTGLNTALEDPQLAAAIAADQQDATYRGVRGVPVVFIDGHRLDGLQPQANYDKYIKESAGKLVALSLASSN